MVAKLCTWYVQGTILWFCSRPEVTLDCWSRTYCCCNCLYVRWNWRKLCGLASSRQRNQRFCQTRSDKSYHQPARFHDFRWFISRYVTRDNLAVTYHEAFDSNPKTLYRDMRFASPSLSGRVLGKKKKCSPWWFRHPRAKIENQSSKIEARLRIVIALLEINTLC